MDFVTDLPKSSKDMAERLKKVPLWYKAASLVTVASLAACQLGRRYSQVTPPPEGTSTPPTETVPPTSTIESQVIFGTGEFTSGDPLLSESLTGFLRENFKIEIPEEATIPFSVKIDNAEFDFISLAPLENPELGIFWDEKLFLKVNNTLVDLDRKEVTIDGNDLIMWSYLNTNNGDMEPVLWYPAITTEQWESMTSEQKANFYAGFAPPSPLEGEISGYLRSLDQVFAISFLGLPEGAFKVRAALRPIEAFPIPPPD
ncbi:MAG: hypothetical protein AAB954_01125, partial [Patescibacteria group bacterium]